jgi:hypothetical protein
MRVRRMERDMTNKNAEAQTLSVLLVLVLALCSMPEPRVDAQQSAKNIDGPLLQALLDLSKTRLASSMVGVIHAIDGRRAIAITSSRQIIASTNARAVESGGRYTPPAEVLFDFVAVRCGSADRINAIFNCAKIVVTSNGQPLRPLTYSAQPETFQSALGARWSAQIVTATFDAASLSDDGFTIDFTSTDGIERTWAVPAEDLDGVLFLRIDPITGATGACAARRLC